MKLGLDEASRERMPVNVLAELDYWLERVELPTKDVGAIRIPSRSTGVGWRCVVENLGMPTGRGKNRHRPVEFESVFELSEFPPRSVWRYMKIDEEVDEK